MSEWADMEQIFGIFKVKRDTHLTLMFSGLERQQAKPFQVFGSKSPFPCSSWALKPIGLCSPVPSLGSPVPEILLGCALKIGVQSTLVCDYVYTKLLMLALCSSHSHGTVNLTWNAFNFLLQSSLRNLFRSYDLMHFGEGFPAIYYLQMGRVAIIFK